MLLYFDKMSMATSLEVRVPFMDHDVVSFCLALPDSRKVRLGNRKELLKRVSRGLVDDEIIDRRKRGFFRSALGAWLRAQHGGLLEETLLDPRTGERGLYRRAEVDRLLAQRRGGRHQGRPTPLLSLPARALDARLGGFGARAGREGGGRRLSRSRRAGRNRRSSR